MATTDMWTALLAVAALAAVVERLMEGLWTSVESVGATNTAFYNGILVDNAPYKKQWTALKTVLSLPIGVTVGIATTAASGLTLGFSSNPSTDKITVGALGGLLAPISHQFILFLTQLQKLLSSFATAGGNKPPIVPPPPPPPVVVEHEQHPVASLPIAGAAVPHPPDSAKVFGAAQRFSPVVTFTTTAVGRRPYFEPLDFPPGSLPPGSGTFPSEPVQGSIRHPQTE